MSLEKLVHQSPRKKKRITIKPKLTKTRIRRNLNVKKVLKPREKSITNSNPSQDNKGEDDYDGVRK
jgi:hypothetical protein